MDPAVAQEWKERIEGSINHHNAQFTQFSAQINDLTQRLTHLTLSSPRDDPSSVPPRQVPEPKIPAPERFGGDPTSCRAFLTQCSMQFVMQPSSFPSEAAKVAYTISLLTGQAKLWGTAEWERRSASCSSFDSFSTELRRVFDPVRPDKEAARYLSTLCQGNRTVDQYAIEFRRYAADTRWNEPACFDAFYRGLSERVKDELAARVLPEDLNGLIEVAASIDRRLKERRGERFRRAPSPLSPQFSVTPRQEVGATFPEEPMQLGRTRLSPEERERRYRQRLCFYCSAAGHQVRNCPVKGQAQ